MEADKVSIPIVDVRQRGDRNGMLLLVSRTGSQNFPRGKRLAIEYLDKGHHADSALSSQPWLETEGCSGTRRMLRNLSVS